MVWCGVMGVVGLGKGKVVWFAGGVGIEIES